MESEDRNEQREAVSGSARRSIVLTRLCVLALLFICCGMMLGGPWITRDFTDGMAREGRWIPGAAPWNIFSDSFPVVLTAGICCGTAAIVMLCFMLRFLRRVERGEVFVRENVVALRRIGQCCGAGAALCLFLGVFVSVMFLFIAAAAAFMMLIVRVVRHAFEQAVRMKDELDYTV